MKTIGLLGGVSWHSTLEYYRLINEIAYIKLGGNNSAKMLIYSFNFHEIRALHEESEEKLCKRLIFEAQNLERAGADCLIIGANTLHIFYQDIQANLEIPVIHIAQATAKAIKAMQMTKVGLLATKITMERKFYADILNDFGISTIVPLENDRKIISDIIYNLLVKGIILKESKEEYLQIINKLINENNIKGLVLGCTEVPLLIKPHDVPIATFNTTEIHAAEAVCFALGIDI
ncbi:MAG: amino acid racemase [Bacteroidales bacterium]|nr:amino acid racemase [Bacteroidales bacterium]